MDTYTLLLVSTMTVLYPHGGELTRNIQEAFNAPKDAIPCHIFKGSRSSEFIDEEYKPLIAKGLKVTVQMSTTCITNVEPDAEVEEDEES